MNDNVDLHYDANTSVGPLDENEINSFQNWLHASGQSRIRFDRSYIDHLKKHHGGAPAKRYFHSASGTKHVIVRFLNFLKKGSNHPLEQYSVPCIWSMIDDRLGPFLVPFAELFAGDMLCFDFGKGAKPEIVIWFHELSQPNQPHTELVSKCFDDFLRVLSDRPS